MNQHKKFLLNCFMVLLVVLFSCASLVEGSLYMPNGIKDKYTFVDRYAGTVESKVDYYSMPNWRHWTQWAGFGPVWVWTHNSHEKVYVFAQNKIQLFADFNASVGSDWSIDIGACNRNVNVKLAAVNEQVVVPAGTFENCILLELETSCADAGIVSIWFAPKVGIVKWVSQSIAGPNPWEFKEGKIGGVTYPKPVAITLNLTGGSDRFEYFINMMPPIDPDRKPVTLFGEFSITNKTGAAIEFVFGPCEFNITIVDENGNVASHMNRGNNDCYLEVAHKKAIGNGETWSFKGKVDLVDEKGNDLPEGLYQVDCVLEGTPRFSTSHTIKITHTH